MALTVQEIFELRRQGRIEEAYEAIRPLYAVHKGRHTTLCMFWTANDILKKRIEEGLIKEAILILKALIRVLPNIDDSSGAAHASVIGAALRLAEATNEFSILDFISLIELTEQDWKPTVSKSGHTLDPLAKRLLTHVFIELRQQPTIDRALMAMPLLQSAISHNPDDKSTRLAMSSVYEIMGEKEKASAMIENGSAEHIMLGRWGEEVAAAYLREKGYIILECNWRSGHRDIDIIARDGQETVFVEVKTRSEHWVYDPEHAINHEKRQNLNRSIGHYMRYRKLECSSRFDVVTVIGKIGSVPEINHYKAVCIMEMKPRR